MFPLQSGLYEFRDEIKKLGGKWNGHIWYIPTNLDYKKFINFIPPDIKDRIEFYGYKSEELKDNQIILAWNLYKYMLGATLKLVLNEVIANSNRCDITYDESIDFFREIEWDKIENAIRKTDMSLFKKIPIAGENEKYYPRGIQLWANDFSVEVGWNDIYDDDSFYAAGPAYEIYLSDELKLTYYELDVKELYNNDEKKPTSRKYVFDEAIQEYILIEYISYLWDDGISFTDEMLEKL